MSQAGDRSPGSGRGRQGPDPGAWDHLAQLIRERRAELGLTQREVHSFGGPSPATLYQLESGRPGSYRPHILRRLERALGWGPGSIRRALAGGLPLLDGDGPVGVPPAAEHPGSPSDEDRPDGPDSRAWVAGFRKLPIDAREKLLILSSLLEETIAGLEPGLAGRPSPAGRRTMARDALPNPVPTRSSRARSA